MHGDRSREVLIAERHLLGLDRHDEIWEGYYVMSPAGNGKHSRIQHQLAGLLGPLADGRGYVSVTEFRLGDQNDFRVPDGGVLAAVPGAVYVDTALVVIEVLAADDAYRKFGFYFRHRVRELLIIDPATDTLQWYRSGIDAFEPAAESDVLGIGGRDLAARLRW